MKRSRSLRAIDCPGPELLLVCGSAVFCCWLLQGSFSLVIEVRHDISQHFQGVNHSNINYHIRITVI